MGENSPCQAVPWLVVAAPAYAAVDEGQGRYFLANSAKRLTASVDRAGLLVRADELAASFSLRTSVYGCAGAMQDVGEREPSAERNRLSFARPELGMEEWYLNGPLGVEQEFSVAEAPSCAGTKVIAMETLGDVAPALEDPDGDGRGEWGRFVADDGQTHFVYRDLVVVDAAMTFWPQMAPYARAKARPMFSYAMRHESSRRRAQ